jgi:hypothetical protein
MKRITKLPNGGYSSYKYDNGDKVWCLNNNYHREDGPAIEWSNGDKYWYINGKRHREDGPAAEYYNGDKEFYLNNKRISQEQFLQLMKLKAFW